MDYRHRPYDPHAPPRDDPAGWVVAGEEPDGWYEQPPPAPYREDHTYGEPQSGDGRYEPRQYPPGRYETEQNGDQGYRTGRSEADWYGTGRHRTGPTDREWHDHSWPASGYPPSPAADPYRPAGAPPARPPAREQYPADPYPPGGWEQPPRHEHYDQPVSPRAQPPWRAEPPDPVEPLPVDSRDELVAEPGSSWLSVFSWALCFFLVPMVLYLGWAFTRGETAAPGCVDDAGVPCLSPRAEALAAFVEVLPALGGAVMLAVLASVVLRRLTAAWRPSTVGFAAAIMGAGLATLVASILR